MDQVVPHAELDHVTVLAVDDDPRNLLAVDAALTGIAASVVKADSGDAALRHLLREDFALVILDVVMPELGGFEVAEMIRKRPRSRHVPIIFMTAARPNEDDVRRGYELGAVDYLIKPVIPDVLRAKASVFVELERRTRQVRRHEARLRAMERAQAERLLAAERRKWEAHALRQQMEEQRRINEELAIADRHKDEFLATLAHELRNPLTPIVSGLELVRPQLERDEQGRRAHTVMLRQANHLARLVDDLMDIARIATGKIALQRSRVDAGSVIEQAIDSCAHLMETRGHELVVDPPETPVVVDADPARLAQIVANLLANAVRYTDPPGRIEIEWSCVGDQLRIRVADDGRGIAPELLPRVFDKFVQRDTGEGLGIGLTLVHELVLLHGGDVEARSEGEGMGSQFIVHLPGARVDEEIIEVSAPPPTASEPRRIVVVEDDPDVRDLLCSLLESRGHDVGAAGTGPAGRDLVIERRPDVALIDLGLPELDGFGVATQIRQSLGRAAPKLVALSGFSQPEHVLGVEKAGFDMHLVKPSTPEEILAAIATPGGEV